MPMVEPEVLMDGEHDIEVCYDVTEATLRSLYGALYEHNILLVPHGWNPAVGLAADLQFAASIPVARYVEYLTPCAYIDELTTEPFRLDSDGYLQIPDAPGLGIEIDPARLARFRRP